MVTPSGYLPLSVPLVLTSRTFPNKHPALFLILRLPSQRMEPLMASLHHPRRPPLLHGPLPTPTHHTTCECDVLIIRQVMPTPQEAWPQHPPNASSTPPNPESGIPHNVPNLSLNSPLNMLRISTGSERRRMRPHCDARNRRVKRGKTRNGDGQRGKG